MKLLNLFLAATLAVGFAACSSDEPAAVNGAETETTTENNDGLYATVKFSFPQSRSTASEGDEIAKDYESAVNSVLVVTATKEADGSYKFLTAAYNDAAYVAGTTTSTYTLYFNNQKALLDQAGKVIFVFAYCNPTPELVTKFCGELDTATGKYSGVTEVADFTDEICGITDLSSTWRKNGFLMTNVEIVSDTLPSTADLKKANSPKSAINLGNIPVIRTAARFDLKAANSTNSYDIVDPSNHDSIQGTVTLTQAALFNTRNEFYYLPRTSAENGLCPGMDGMEVENEIVVVTPENRNFSKMVNPFALDSVDTAYDWTTISKILGSEDDNDDNWVKGDNSERTDYHIWKYTTENVLASTSAAELNKQITGVVFEAEITGVTGQSGTLAMYEFEDMMYGNVNVLYNYVKEAPGSKIEEAFKATFTGDEGNWTEAEAVNGKTEYAGFTIFRPNEDGKHNCYYFYYNRHNNDDDPTAIGKMEFATVRNNVYKLCVTNINKFGTFTAPDPASYEIYFNVNVEVKPWVVRINDIEF